MEGTGYVKNVMQIDKRDNFETSSKPKHNFETILLRGLSYISCFAKAEYPLCFIPAYFLQVQLFVQFVEEKFG